MEFKEYESKPIKRKAYCIKEVDFEYITNIKPNLFELDGTEFQAYEEIKVGSYIVYLNKDDVYHCNEEVFKDRNIVKE